MLVAALTEADLVSALEADGPFTVFAPTDQAFADLLSELDITQGALLERDDLADILRYHVVEGEFSAEDVLALTSDGPATVETLEGSEVTLSVTDGDVFVNDVKVATTDVFASNGVIHVLEGVLLPESEEDANGETELLELTLEELSHYDGQEGRDAYIAVDGNIYDVTDSSLWGDGSHQGSVTAGQDLTEELDNNTRHGREVLEGIPLIGVLV